LKILIVGGGIGSLTLAGLLQQRDIPFSLAAAKRLETLLAAEI
jgi:2-polyprenyl-6-methoxyphenol hydroxylase-like FAD-dependent oxidoreductase